MPSLTLGKRRHEEDDIQNGNVHIALYANIHINSHHPHGPTNAVCSPESYHDGYMQEHYSPPKKPITFPSPLAKRLRMTTSASETIPSSIPTSPRQHRTRSPSTTTRSQQHIASPRPTRTNLSPCHICHRKPTKKNELDSYADCEGCGERTCYVCIRACLGWKRTATTAPQMEEIRMRDDDHNDGSTVDTRHYDYDGSKTQTFHMEDAAVEECRQNRNEHEDVYELRESRRTWGQSGGRGHRARICSQCCVEEGLEGDVICLGCLGT